MDTKDIISLISCLILLICLIIVIIKFKKAKCTQFNQWKSNYLNELNKKYNDLNTEYDAKILLIKDLNDKIKIIENDIESKSKFNETVHKMREQELDRLIEEEKEHKLALVDLEVQDWAASAQEVARDNYNQLLVDQEKEIQAKKEQVKYLITQLAEQQSKIEAVNREILRQRAIEEKNEFYSIQISDSAKNDIEILNEIRPRLSSLEIFNKFIYDNYIGKPTKEMVQRVLAGKNPSGIYKVTNIKTHESYIGKSVKIADRWQNHVKAASGLGGVAESQFQRALKKYGVDQFTWEVVEETEKDELSSREKYWIKFYNTKQYGYNEREG